MEDFGLMRAESGKSKGKMSRNFPSFPEGNRENTSRISLSLTGKISKGNVSLSVFLKGKMSRIIENFPQREKLEKYREFPWEGNAIYTTYIYSVPFPHGQGGK
jgi:hypothetical protein